MINCGIGACALNSGSCASTLLTMWMDGVLAIWETIGTVITFGLDAPAVAAAKEAF